MLSCLLLLYTIDYYLRRRLASEGIVTLGVRVCVSHCVCLCVSRAATARHISLGGEGNALYEPVSSVSSACSSAYAVVCFNNNVSNRF